MNTLSTDIAIIGAGVIGLAIASKLALKSDDVVILERNASFGQEASSRNSEVIHAGMNYPPGTLKASLCVEGKNLLYEICSKNSIPFKKTGKLIVALGQDELPALEKISEQGRKNGVMDLEIWDAIRIKKMEPEVNAFAALYSPSTGIIDSHKLMEYFIVHAKNNGALISFNSDVINIEREGRSYKILVRNGEETFVLTSRIVINCAGLDSDIIAKMAGLNVEKSNYGLHYCKGQYFRLSSLKGRCLNRLVYPAPRPKAAGLGIHATLDLGGGLRLGPDDEYLKTREKNYTVDISKKHDFYSSVKQFLPFIEENDLLPDIAGIRPKLQGPDEDFRDFVIKEESGNGLPNLINLIGIESPGLTASAAIAESVKGIYDAI